MTDFAHLSVEARALIFASPHDRRRAINSHRYCPFPAGDSALNAILALGESTSRQPISIVQLRGPPRTGKATILQEAHGRLGVCYPLERRSVFYLTDPSPSPSRFYHRLLIAGEVPHVWNGRAETYRWRIQRTFEQQNVRVLLASKIHNAAATARLARRYLPLVRTFCEEGGFNVAFSTNRAPKELIHNDPDLAALTTEFVLGPWPVERWALEAIQRAIRHFPLRRPTDLDDGLLSLLYGMTGGLPGKIFPLLSQAGCLAIDSGEEAITQELLRRARSGGRPL